MVSFVKLFFNISKSTIPFSSTSKYVTLNPCFSKSWKHSKTEGCSILDVMMCLCWLIYGLHIPNIARLLASVALPVNTIFLFFKFRVRQIEAVALSSNVFDVIPNWWVLLSLYQYSLLIFVYKSIIAGFGFVVDALSK